MRWLFLCFESISNIEFKEYELAKLAVNEKYKGMKIGNALLEKCMETSRKEKIKKIILYTNRNLVPAIGLYKKFGFKKLPIINNKYLEADMKMEMQIDGRTNVC